jgi:hypothetical protein
MDTRWDDAFKALAAFVSSHERLPQRNSGDAGEEKLIRWLYQQRAKGRNGTLAKERVSRLDGLCDWRQQPRVERENAVWAAKLKELQDFVAVQGRFPGRAASAAADERGLAVFLNRQRRSAREGILSAERAGLLDEAVPGWNWRPAESWRQRQVEAHRAAARERLDGHREVILAGLASGRTVTEMAAMTGVPHQLMFGVARYDRQWSKLLEAALMEGRVEGLDHGSLSAYRYGCRCLPCRHTARSGRKPRRSRAKQKS